METFEAVIFGRADGVWLIVERRAVTELSGGLDWLSERLSQRELWARYDDLCARVFPSAGEQTAQGMLEQLSSRVAQRPAG